MRSLGDDYVKSGMSARSIWEMNRHCTPARPPPSEFRKHKEVTNPVYIMGFLTQWKMYLDQLPAGPGAHAYKGKRLDPTVFEKVSTSVPVGEIDTEH